MATFSSVTRTHVLQAIAEYDSRGGEDFLALYGFGPSRDYVLVHEGRSYDSKAVLGVAHKYATGRLATSDEFSGGMTHAVAILRKRGFEVTGPPTAAPRVAAPRTRTPRVTAPRPATPSRAAAAREATVAICPTCSTALPATGVCDYCG
ncbi:hypothetical protein [Actinotalea solisilvae]|uniref:hypothetical protein n=1 Tax=Actinotalea solisilvae TaxID=2072922 RepID=UPI0018F17F1D|nr:hypothetical protein [Actinotalea solisilvae]